MLSFKAKSNIKVFSATCLIVITARADADNSFERFFTENKYIDNPFGKDFIKLEVDLDRFDTNKTSINIALLTPPPYLKIFRARSSSYTSRYPRVPRHPQLQHGLRFQDPS